MDLNNQTSDQSNAYSDYIENYKLQIGQSLNNMFSNIYYTWNKDLYDLADKLDGYEWTKINNPAVVVQKYLEEHSVVDQDLDFSVLSEGLLQREEYLGAETWFDKNSINDPRLATLKQNPILYISAEFGLIDWLQIYSGGLGVLAGDFLKQASDHGIPLVAVGIFYNQGYFQQDIDLKGVQQEVYIPQDAASSKLRLIKDGVDKLVEVSVMIKDHEVFIRGWELKVGRNKLILLDTNYSKNEKWEDRMITAHLYGGTNDTRIRQEIVLGIGGYKFAQQMGINPGIVHLNEGHASFLILEKAKEFVEQGSNLPDSINKAKENVLFTNHTLNPAGNDKFEFNLLEPYLSYYAKELKSNFNSLFELGADPLYSNGSFSMTILGLKASKISNAVSKLHGEAAKKLWPDYQLEAITNGVHMPTWVAKPVQELLDKYVSPDWRKPESNINWELIRQIPNEELWKTHLDLKMQAIKRINSTLGLELRTDALTMVWTRRFAAYKRPDIFLSDLERLEKILNADGRPIQFLIGGKAHPQDLKGKDLLQKVISISFDPKFKNKVAFLTAYNWNLARYVVAGADIWLNNPIRFEEASGTSGMKAGANGALQYTTLDGWTDEVDWNGKGFVLPQENIYEDIYNILENTIVPKYFESKQPDEWINMMKETMIVCLSRYNMGRMLEEYLGLYGKLSN